MGRRRRQGGLEALVYCPWWVSIVIGLIAFAFLRWLVPSMFASNPYLSGLAMVSRSLAWIALPIFGMVALISFFKNIRPIAIPVFKTSQSSKPRNLRQEPTLNSEWGRSYGVAAKAEIEPSPQRMPNWTVESLQSLEWKRFELLCAKYYEVMGFKSVTLACGPDGGIDVKLYKNESQFPIAIVQCKAWSSKPVGVKEIRELLGVMVHEKVARGIFITSGVYSSEALKFSEKNPIQMLDGRSFIDRILKLEKSHQDTLGAFAFSGDYRTPTCASCGIKMVKRQGKAREFWGCVNFPKCRNVFVKAMP